MVRPKRFELLTPWFVAKYSIQLSYGRMRSIIRETACFLKLKLRLHLAESEGFSRYSTKSTTYNSRGVTGVSIQCNSSRSRIVHQDACLSNRYLLVFICARASARYAINQNYCRHFVVSIINYFIKCFLAQPRLLHRHQLLTKQAQRQQSMELNKFEVTVRWLLFNCNYSRKVTLFYGIHISQYKFFGYISSIRCNILFSNDGELIEHICCIVMVNVIQIEKQCIQATLAVQPPTLSVV